MFSSSRLLCQALLRRSPAAFRSTRGAIFKPKLASNYALRFFATQPPRGGDNEPEPRGRQTPYPSTEEIKSSRDDLERERDPLMEAALKDLKAGEKRGSDKDAKQDEELEDDSSFVNESKRSIYIFCVAAIGLIGGYLVMQVNVMRDEKKTQQKQKVYYTGKADIGGPWRLIDMAGNVVTHEALRGSYYLIYFGFCNCPDICPNSLHKLSKALELIRRLPESKFFKLKTLFVSVDPDRDTPERMAKFLSLFDKSIVGLTGTSNDDPELKKMMRSFKIYASRIELGEDDEEEGGKEKAQPKPVLTKKGKPYTIDHTIITYLMDDRNEFLTHLGSNLSEHDLAQTIMNQIMEHEKNKGQRKRVDY